MIYFMLIGALVFQNGDTLRFVADGVMLESMIIADSVIDDSSEAVAVRRAQVAEDNRFFFIYEALRRGEYEITRSRISFYDAGKNLLFTAAGDDAAGRQVAFELARIRGGWFIVATWDRHSSDPAITALTPDTLTRIEIIEQGAWQQVLDYAMSPNGQYALFHARNPYNNKVWDYIYFRDLTTGATWDYMLPVCASCKRTPVRLAVGDDGRSEVIYNVERRTFSRSGELEGVSVGGR